MQRSIVKPLGTAKKGPTRFLFLLLLILGLSSGCDAELEPPPDEILGVWSTEASSHAGRTFEISKSMIRFGTGEYSAPATFSVIGVERGESINGEEVFVIHHRESDGSESETRVAYRQGQKPSMMAGTPPSLRFVNRKEIWTQTARAASDG